MKQFIISLVLSIVSINFCTAQVNNFSYGLGLNRYELMGKTNSSSSLNPAGGFSPYIGVNYHLQQNKIPISLGLRANMFELNTSHNNPNPQIRLDQYIFSHNLQYIQLQMPVAYNPTFGNNEIMLAVSPTLYFNTQAKFYSTLPEPSDSDIKAHSSGYSYIQPQSILANIDLSIAYAYYFSKIKNHQLGVKVYASYPLTKAISTHTNYEYDIDYKNGDKIGKSTAINDYYAPFSLSVGLILR